MKYSIARRLATLCSSILLLASAGTRADTFADFFDVVSYANQDGNVNWATDWSEGNDDGNPATGDVQVTGGELLLKDGNVRLTRSLDLSGYDAATISFDYREVGYDNNQDQVRLQVRSGGSGGWTNIVRYRGSNVNTGSASFQVPTVNLAANTEFRFRTGNNTGNNDEFYIDNLIITALVTVPGGDFADFFDVVAYSNQDGSRLFDTDWAETNDDGSAASGDIQITGGELRLKDRRVRLTRELDLSGFATATLTFDYREVGFDNNQDQVFVEIRSGGSGGWTRLVRYRGANVNTGSASFELPAANLAANTEIRFRTGNNTGNNDEFYVNDFIITVTAVPSSVLDHFDVDLSSGTFGINCVAHQLKITAHDSLHGTVTGYTGEIQLATSTLAGDWSDGGLGNVSTVANGTAGDGIATYQFFAGDNGEADFYLDYTTGGSNIVGIDVNDTTDILIIDDSTETIQFAPSGLTLTQGVLSNPPPNPINDPVTTQVAGTSFVVHLAAYGQTPTDTDCGIIEAYTGNHELHFWSSYDNPSSGTLTPTVDGQSALDQECSVPGPPDCDAPANKQTVNFTNGQASVMVKYKDAGSISLNVKDDDFEAAESHSIPGTSGPFVVQPDDFIITTIETGAAVANPGTTSSGNGFVAAGESFHVVVEARDAEGSLLPNYGNETSAEGIRLLLASLVYPAGGNAGSISNPTSFSATATPGEFENSVVSWTEAGTITVSAGVGDGDYLGAGDVVGSPSGNVGRFYPAEFTLVSSSATNSCGAGNYSYMSEPAISVSYTVEARSQSAAVVSNYDEADLGFAVATPSVHAEDSNDGNDRRTRLTIPDGQWDDGVLTLASTTASFNRDTTPDGPYSNLQLGLSISDQDGADFSVLDYKPADNNDCVLDGDCTGAAIGAALDLRFGRMHLNEAFGPELAPLPMVWQNEYWDGSKFTRNSDDHCTNLAIADVTFTGASTTVDAATDTITVTIGGISSVFSFSDPVGSSDCLTATDIVFCDGQAGTQYGAPGTVVTYPLSVDLTNLPFLRFDWDQDGNHNDAGHPPIDINFQSYRGHDRVIYWQETLR